MNETKKTKPAVQAIRVSPITGTPPPAEYQYRPGTSGNYRGRPAAGMSWLEEVNRMASWPEMDVRAVAKDKKAPLVARAAARDLLRWNSDKTTKAGLPLADNSANRILDRSVGRPVQSIISQQITEAPGDFENLSTENMRMVVAILQNATRQVPPATPTPLPELPAEKSS